MEDKLLNIELDEEFLDENLPRDLAKAYQRAVGHASQRRPDYSHTEVNGGVTRRAVNYDYANSKYEVKSAEEAIAMIKANKQECSNFRILYDGDLIELEMRDNGTIYPIYGSGTPVTLDKPYKNIRYANWKVILNYADKIYYTDEYDHPISDEVKDRRAKNSTIRALYKNIDPNDLGYDPHKPYDNMLKKGEFAADELDTGDHNITSRWNITGKASPNDTEVNRFGRSGINIRFDEYVRALNLKRTTYIRFNNIRKALKKLEREKDDLDIEDYTETKKRFEDIFNELKSDYADVAKKCSDEKQKVIKYIDKKSEDSNKILLNYTHDIQKALTRSYEIKKEYEGLKNTVLTRRSGTFGYEEDETEAIRKINSAFDSIGGYIKELNEIQKAVDTYKHELPEISADIENSQSDTNIPPEEQIKKLEDSIKEQTDIIEKASKLRVVNQLKKLKEYEDEVVALNQEIARLRPRAAAEKAARQAKQKTPELDSSLADIIEFTDFVNL